jgi:hypothetical protein
MFPIPELLGSGTRTLAPLCRLQKQESVVENECPTEHTETKEERHQKASRYGKFGCFQVSESNHHYENNCRWSKKAVE